MDNSSMQVFRMLSFSFFGFSLFLLFGIPSLVFGYFFAVPLAY